MGAQDEAGPYQAIPQPGVSWQPEGHPARPPHEYERGGTAKRLPLFRPATGEIRAKGVVAVTNAVLHPWLKGKPGCGRMRVLRAFLPCAASWCWIIWRDTCPLTYSAGSSIKE